MSVDSFSGVADVVSFMVQKIFTNYKLGSGKLGSGNWAVKNSSSRSPIVSYIKEKEIKRGNF
jgi:hypothetical protein